MLGISLLGPREIAKCLRNKKKISCVFSSIYCLQFFSHTIAIVSYLIFSYINTNKSTVEYFFILHLLSSMFDISWFFIGIEDFKNVSIRNVCIRVLSFVSLFIFVKSNDDIFLYIATLYVPQLLLNIYMWYVYIKNDYKLILNVKNVGRYIKEAISLFIPQIASSVYMVLDKVILALYVPYAITAIYAQGQTILTLFIAVVPSFCKIMSPRIASCIERKSDKDINKYMDFSSNVVSFFSVFIFFWILSCSSMFVSWYLPEGYEKTADVLKTCALITLFVGGANLISIEYLIPLGKQKVYTTSILISSIVNVLLNFLLIPRWGLYGVCIGSVVAEAIGFFIQFYFASRFLNYRRMFSKLYIYIVSGIIFYFLLIIIQKRLITSLGSIITLSVIGLFTYSVIVYALFRAHGKLIVNIFKNSKRHD